MQKRIVFAAIGCVCGNCLQDVRQGTAIWYEGGLANVDGCVKCDEDCKKTQKKKDKGR